MDDVVPPTGGPGFLAGGGEVGALMRARDWQASPLGAPETWPQSLRSVVGLLLSSKFPMFVAWGPELGFLYNDSYAEILGAKHPRALGARFHDIWAEIWPDILPLIDAALAGEASYHENLPLVMNRQGFDEQTWFTFSYSPVRDEDDHVAGMFCACTETTEQVLTERRQAFRLALEERLRDLADPADVIAVASEALGQHLGAARVGYAELQPDDLYTHIESDWRAAGTASVAGHHRLADYGPAFVAEYRAGRTVAIDDFATDPRSAGTPAVEAHAALGVSAQAVVPLVKAGRLAALLFVHSAKPRRWPREDLGLVEEVAERTWAAVERARAEAALRESEARFRTAADGSPALMWMTDEQGQIVFANRRYKSFFGVEADEMLGDGWRAIVHAEDVDAFHDAFNAAFLAREPFHRTVRVNHPTLGVRWLSCDGGPRHGEGQFLGYAGVNIDMTDAVVAEAELRESEARFRNMADHAPVMMWVTDPSGACLYLNRGWYEFTGQTTAEAEGFGWLDAVHPDDRGWSGNTFLAANAKREAFRLEYRLRRADGAYRWAIDAASPRFGADGAFLGYVGSVIDIDERREAETRLALSEEQLRLATEAAEVGLWDVDLVTDTLFWPPRVKAMFGISPEVPVSMADFYAGLHPDDRDETARAFEAACDPGRRAVYDVEYRTVGKEDGVVRWVAAKGRGLFTAEGVCTRIVGTAIDVTARKADEARLRELNETLEQRVAERTAELETAHEALRQSQKMEAVGQLTGGLAHDFNNLLAGVQGSLELMGTRLQQGRVGDVDRYLLAAQGAAKRAAALTQRLLAFARRQTLEPKPTNVNALVTGMEDLIRRTVGPQVAVDNVIGAGVWSVLVDPSQLENALLNLAINARDAMPEGGKLTIETANRWLDERAARARDLSPGQYVSVCVSDTGTGMTPEVAARAFDPFYTTKPLGLGTGLGLSMVYGFARQSGGQARIYSEPGQGATVCLYLPRHLGEADATEAAQADAPVVAPARAGETVLVIDDEPVVRMLVADVLEEMGYAALEAGDGPAGLKVLQSSARVDLLITDVGLPGGLNGRQVADAARALRPRLPVLFITGYAENAVLNHGHLEHGMQVVTKPFAVEELGRRVQAILSEG